MTGCFLRLDSELRFLLCGRSDFIQASLNATFWTFLLGRSLKSISKLSSQVSHEFPLNFIPDNPLCAGRRSFLCPSGDAALVGNAGVRVCVCVGIEEIVAAYRVCLPQIKLYGPTNFSPVINNVAWTAKQALQQTTAAVSNRPAPACLRSFALCESPRGSFDRNVVENA